MTGAVTPEELSVPQPDATAGKAAGSHGRYWRSVAMLTTGSSISQAVGIASMLVLARIYAPEEFGNYTLFFAIAGLLSLVATAKYDAAVFIARGSSEAAQIAILAASVSTLLGILILAFAPFSGLVLGGFAKQPILFMVLLAAATTSGGLMAATTAWATQIHEFGAVTIARLVQALAAAAISIGLGLAGWDATGLMLGFVIGQSLLCVYLVIRLGFMRHVRRFTWRTARVRARRNASFPKFMLASELINYVGANLISFVTSPLFGAAALGQYSLGFRMATMPINLIGQSMNSVFKTAISPQHLEPSQIPAMYRTTFVRLCAIGLVLTLPLMVAGPLIMRLAFGAKWAPAGLYVQILAPLIFVRFVVGPLTAIAIRAGRQRLDTMLQTLFLIAALAGLGFGAWMHSFVMALAAFSLLQTLVYLLYLVVGYRLALELGKETRVP
jgi:O-antigen/teichoic acid export membrane protein